jgi:hypothetical protein
MKGKNIFAWLILTALALCAFGTPPVPRPDADAKVIFQFLTVVHEDGSAEFQYIIKFSKEQIEENLSGNGYSEDELCSKTTSGIQGNLGGFTQEKHGEEIWCTYSVEMDNLQGLSKHLEDGFTLDVQRLEIAEDTFYLDLSWTRFPCTTNDPSKFTCEWTVEAPGKVGENNATRVDGNTLTWDMMLPSTPNRFTAQSQLGGFDPTALIVVGALMCGCCLVTMLIACGAAVFFYFRKRNQPPTESNPAAAPSQSASPSSAENLRL